jgi:hypothetical protein
VPSAGLGGGPRPGARDRWRAEPLGRTWQGRRPGRAGANKILIMVHFKYLIVFMQMTHCPTTASAPVRLVMLVGVEGAGHNFLSSILENVNMHCSIFSRVSVSFVWAILFAGR